MLSCFSAVAENQPANKHRMNTELFNFAARLRGLIHQHKFLAGEQELHRRFDSLALELFALQFQNNFAYKKICEARGRTPKTVEHWTQIPAVPTAAFKELELTCLAQNERTAVFYSSGTTEQKPGRHFHNAESLAVYETSLWPWFHFYFGADGQLVFLTPNQNAAPRSSLVHMFETVRQKFGLPESAFVGQVTHDGMWTVDFAVTVKKLKAACEQLKPVTLLGTAFSFVHLLDYFSANNLTFKLPRGSRAMETGGYKNHSRILPKNELHSLIAERLGIPQNKIICEYGMSELSSQAYDSEIQNVGRGFHFPPWVRVQIISPETGLEVCDGETGLIRVFDLANVFSVMAVQTEDLGIRRGDGFELIGRAQLAETRGCSLMTA
jgi:phenylacetate-coenzyme A ligase PaaK-like adenylate-forming protein